MRALVSTAHGVYELDVEMEEVLGTTDAELEPRPFESSLPRVVAGDSVGALAIAVVDARPPLLISRDLGRTWSSAGGGLPAGRDVAIHPDEPDLVLYAARNRLYLSRDGGRFWRVLAPELPEIEGVAWR